ncbi:MAG: thermonuclease family protein [Phascolarctobacterium sp.]|nr:thermonuclease family protein [Phascolarctobacterium sp.]
MFKYFVSAIVVFVLCLSSYGMLGCQAQRRNTYNHNSAQTHNYQSERTAQKIYGSVVHVADGDTITVQTKSGEKFKIRLFAIDAPEKAQPYGPQSAGILKNLLLNHYVSIDVQTVDRYGRKVAVVYRDNEDINAEMIKLGAAWHYKHYDKSANYNKYDNYERAARENQKGLWNKMNPTPPWEYRKMMREQNKR